MQYRPLGATGLDVSVISFGAGPVPALMTGGDPHAQRRAVARAIELGVNWFDTAAGYGNGQSEQSLGAALAALGNPAGVHVATKVRLREEDLVDVPRAVEQSVRASLARLKRERITLLQIHHAITRRRGDESASITPHDVLGTSGLLAAIDRLRRDGIVQHLGLTGTGHPEALREVIASGAFATVQAPYHLLNPSAGQVVPADFDETDFGNLIESCRTHRVGVFAIRVFAGGALVGHPPSRHTYQTPYFPLPLYLRDQQQADLVAQSLAESLAGTLTLKEAALRFALSCEGVTSAIIGFAEVQQVEEAVALAAAGPLPHATLMHLQELVARARRADFATRKSAT